MKELPEGWVEVALGDLVEPKETRNPSTDGTETFRYLDVKAIDNSNNRIGVVPEVPSRNAPSRARRLVKKDDVLFCLVRPYLRNIALVPPAFDGEVASTAFCVLRATGAITSRFLFYQVLQDSFVDSVPTYGNSPPAAREDEFLKLCIDLPPVSDQDRIVARIESLFATLDDGLDALKRAEANLERYRASVLKAAVEGGLTARWRKENPPAETGQELLRRILAERRKRWEQEQLAKFAEKGRRPPRNWKSKYKEAVAPDATELPELPRGWCWATVDQLAQGMQNGRSVREQSDGFPVLRLGAITGGVLHEEEVKEGAWEREEAGPFIVRPGDFVVCRGNGSIDLVGRASFASNEVGEVAFPDTMIRVDLTSGDLVQTRFIAAIWNSSLVRRQIVKAARTSAGIHKVNQSDLRRIEVPVPPAAEQRSAVRVLDALVREHAEVVNRIRTSLRGVSALRQSILKSAFEGRLVGQKPEGQPAPVLFERIQAQEEGCEEQPDTRAEAC